ncbi:hypothetical protein OG21DRAFT_758770 [Imleria badia]|nr:hypothetical protein OG21DRAFT_758770 [Imleria badia]
MNFSLAQDSPFNTVLVSPEGRVLYRIDTPSFLHPSSLTITTTVKRVSMDGLSEAEVGRVVWQSGRPGTVVVHGHELNINRSKFFSSSRTFMALNGQSYKWSFENDSSLVRGIHSLSLPSPFFPFPFPLTFSIVVPVIVY